MENLVIQLKKIHFQQDFPNEFTQNNGIDLQPLLNVQSCSEENMNASCSKECPENRLSPLVDVDEKDDATNDGERESSCTTDTDYESDEKKEHDMGDNYNEDSNQMYSGIHTKLRKMPQRISKLRSQKLRIAMKPPKLISKSTTNLRPSQIEKLYTNQKLTKFKHTNLETIFEEPQNLRGRAGSLSPICEDSQYRFIGSAKHRRFLKCCDGFNVNKTLMKHRRAMVKKNFGRRQTWKKMPLDSFLQHLKNRCNSESGEEDKTFEIEKPRVSNIIGMPPIIGFTTAEEEEMED